MEKFDKNKIDRRYRFAKRFTLPYFGRIFKKKYGFKPYTVTLPDGPNIILCNHVTTYEPMIAVACCDKPMRIVTAKDFINIRFRRLFDKYFAPIWKDKNLHDASVAVEIMRSLKAGCNVLMFPEGNRTFSSRLCYINEATAKLVRACRVNVVFLNFVGGFSIDPRFSLDYRKGKIDLIIRKTISKEEIAKMSLEEIEACIKENLTVNDVPSAVPSISDKRAEKLERVLYRCPVCGAISTIYSHGNLVGCRSCELEVTYGERLLFENPNKEEFKHKELYEWYKEQEDYVRSSAFEKDDLIYLDNDVNLEDIGLDHETMLSEHIKVMLFGDRLVVGEHEFPFTSIREMTVSGKQTFLFYVGDITYRVSSSIVGFNALKYVQMYYHLYDKERGIEDKFLGI